MKKKGVVIKKIHLIEKKFALHLLSQGKTINEVTQQLSKKHPEMSIEQIKKTFFPKTGIFSLKKTKISKEEAQQKINTISNLIAKQRERMKLQRQSSNFMKKRLEGLKRKACRQKQIIKERKIQQQEKKSIVGIIDAEIKELGIRGRKERIRYFEKRLKQFENQPLFAKKKIKARTLFQRLKEETSQELIPEIKKANNLINALSQKKENPETKAQIMVLNRAKAILSGIDESITEKQRQQAIQLILNAEEFLKRKGII